MFVRFAVAAVAMAMVTHRVALQIEPFSYSSSLEYTRDENSVVVSVVTGMKRFPIGIKGVAEDVRVEAAGKFDMHGTVAGDSGDDEGAESSIYSTGGSEGASRICDLCDPIMGEIRNATSG